MELIGNILITVILSVTVTHALLTFRYKETSIKRILLYMLGSGISATIFTTILYFLTN